MLHLPISLRDAIVDLTIPPLTPSNAAGHYHHYHRTEDGSITRYHHPHRNHRQNRSWNCRRQISSSSASPNEPMSRIRLLSRPRIVGTAQPTSSANSFFQQSASTAARGGRDMSSLLSPGGGGRIGVKISDGGGVSCMDLDRGNDDSFGSSSSSPPRYLLVGSGGGDCSIALYDLSCFGSDAYLYHSTCSSSLSSSSSNNDNSSNNAIISSQNNLSFRSNDPALWTHRPIARSLRQNALSSSNVPENVVVNGVPSGHRHPLRGVHWYPGEFIILIVVLL